MLLKAPFPWFGGKSRAASEIWRRFGDVPNYVEPFAGSLAVLLMRPHKPRTETINDIDCYIANFWRAVANEPEKVADYADWPCNEADLHARHLWLLGRSEFRERMKSDPDYYDAKIAGWWVWGQCLWIGGGWCAARWYRDEEGTDSLPSRPDMRRPDLTAGGKGVHRSTQDIYEYFAALGARLRRVRVTCGDWTRVLSDAATVNHGITGILLDPPYSHDERDDQIYSHDLDVAADVRAWAIENGDNPMLRIALCGYEGEHEMPPDWSVYRWKTSGGYGKLGSGRGLENARRETIWFSPHCLPAQSLSLFDLDGEEQ
jgi:hypothetical protein